MKAKTFSFSEFTSHYFGWLGALVSKVFYFTKRSGFDEKLEDAGLRIFPDSYFSLIGFIFLICYIPLVQITLLTGIVPLLLLPFTVLLVSYVAPFILARGRSSKREKFSNIFKDSVIQADTTMREQPPEPSMKKSSKQLSTNKIIGLFVSLIHPIRRLVSLSLVASGAAVLVWIGWLTWIDITQWSKDLGSIFLGSRIGETVSLGIGMTIFNYFLISISLLTTGIVFFFGNPINFIKSKLVRSITPKPVTSIEPNQVMPSEPENDRSQNFSFLGFIYRYFGWFGVFVSKVFYITKRSRLDEKLEDAGFRIFPDAYFSLIGFIFLICYIPLIPITIVTGLIPLLLLPFIVILLGYAIPIISARDRASKLDLEVPFAGTYVSVMATGGLSPFESFKKLEDCKLLPQFSKAVKDIQTDVQMRGEDPVSAMEKSAQHLPSKEFKDFILGYTSSLKTGGDVVHYLLIRTETMFRDLAAKIKAFGDRAGALMEGYIALTILTSLGFSIIFMTTMAFSDYWTGGFTPEMYLLYAYLLVPGISIAFVYLGDAQQVHEPITEWGPYRVFLATLPVMGFLALTMFLPFVAPQLTLFFAVPFKDFVIWLTSVLGLQQGFEASIGLAIALLVGTIPAMFAHSHYMKRGKGLENDITNFLRDMTETRKTGASPEACLENLAGRNYGGFTNHLIVASRQIRWGLPFKAIYHVLESKIRSWLALINLYLLVDAIEVGGGSPETMETLTRFSELLTSLEKEKKAALRPLLIMPYIGAGLLLFSTIIFLGFMQTILLSYGQQSMPFSQFATIILPPLILQAYLTGLVTGKISSTTLSTGFKHAVILVIMAVIMLYLSPYFSLPFESWG